MKNHAFFILTIFLFNLSNVLAATVDENLITNGDFENTSWDAAKNKYSGFISTYARGTTSVIEGGYTLVSTARNVHTAWTNSGDHSSGNGKYFVANGGPVASMVWQTDGAITVDVANKDYRFEVYISTVFRIDGTNAYAPNLKFQIGDGTNWIDMGVTIAFSDPTCDNNNNYTTQTDDDTGAIGVCNTASTNHIGQWIKASVDGNFSNTGNYYIRLLNNQTGSSGNDFGLDDISFKFKNTTTGTAIDTSGLNNSPTITAGGTTAFTQQTPIAVANGIIILEPDGNADWNGGTLKVQISTNSTANDSLTIPTINPGGNEIWIDGTAIKEDTTQIATASAASVSNNTEWTLTFNANATNANVQKVGRAIIYNNTSANPSTANRSVKFTATDKNGSAKSDLQTITINKKPTLTSFANVVDHTNPETEVEITLAELKAQGDEADADGTVDGFVIKTLSTGSLKIGTSTATATDFHAANNNTVNSTNKAYWIPSNGSDEILNAFTTVALDNDTAESTTARQVQVFVTIDNNVTPSPGSDNLTFSSTASLAGNPVVYTLAIIPTDDNPKPPSAPVSSLSNIIDIDSTSPGNNGYSIVVIFNLPAASTRIFSGYWKYGPEAGGADHWYDYGTLAANGNNGTGYEITNGGKTLKVYLIDGIRGDDVLGANAAIKDPGLPLLLDANGNPIPSLSFWGLMILSLIIAFYGTNYRKITTAS
ncbi:MAG: hypothetical protein QM504_03870 [Pseudomonadota bacterium]